ncbi:MAG: RecX family transcriptional regulator [Chloroflexi bacterium]|nr:RecX family transcriptional regulator [Chloroflexota bacterium]
MRITSLERRPRRRTLDLYVDDELALTLSRDICVTFDLRAGEEISAERLTTVREAEAKHIAMKSALRLLAYTPRSEHELRDRLGKKGIAVEVRDATIRRLREVGLVNDAEYARSFVESRNRTSPRGRRLVAAELRSKGVDVKLAEESASALNDADAAYRAAARRAQSLSKLDHQSFRRRLGNFLLQRGFDFETSSQTVARLWAEAHSGAPNGASD